MRYYVWHYREDYKDYWEIKINYGDGSNNASGAYATYTTEQEAIEKCEKLNAMLYPQPYIFIER